MTKLKEAKHTRHVPFRNSNVPFRNSIHRSLWAELSLSPQGRYNLTTHPQFTGQPCIFRPVLDLQGISLGMFFA